MLSQEQRCQEETALNPTIYKHFHCKICNQNAEQPIVTQCGHLFCWNCVHYIKHCKVCGRQLDHAQFIPIYTSYENNDNRGDQYRSQVFTAPPKPKGKNRQRIKNFNSIGNPGFPLSLNLFNNVQRQVVLAGPGLFPPLVINMFVKIGLFQGNNDQDLEQINQQNTVKTPIKLFNFLLIVIFLIGIVLS